MGRPRGTQERSVRILNNPGRKRRNRTRAATSRCRQGGGGGGGVRDLAAETKLARFGRRRRPRDHHNVEREEGHGHTALFTPAWSESARRGRQQEHRASISARGESVPPAQTVCNRRRGVRATVDAAGPGSTAWRRRPRRRFVSTRVGACGGGERARCHSSCSWLAAWWLVSVQQVGGVQRRRRQRGGEACFTHCCLDLPFSPQTATGWQRAPLGRGAGDADRHADTKDVAGGPCQALSRPAVWQMRGPVAPAMIPARCPPR